MCDGGARTHARTYIHDTRGAGRDGLHHPIKIGTIMLNFAQILQILRCVCGTRDRERVCVCERVFVYYVMCVCTVSNRYCINRARSTIPVDDEKAFVNGYIEDQETITNASKLLHLLLSTKMHLFLKRLCLGFSCDSFSRLKCVYDTMCILLGGCLCLCY